LRNQDRTIDSFNSLQIFHQNIIELRSKTDELINYLETDNINPHALYFSKHHMEEQNLITGYILGSSFFHQNLQKADMCIFIHKDLYFSKINNFK